MVYRDEDKQFVTLVAKRYGSLPESKDALYAYIDGRSRLASSMLECGDLVGAAYASSEAIFYAVAFDSCDAALRDVIANTSIAKSTSVFCVSEPKNYRHVARQHCAELFRVGDEQKAQFMIRKTFADYFDIMDFVGTIVSQVVGLSLSVSDSKSEADSRAYCDVLNELLDEISAALMDTSDTYDMDITGSFTDKNVRDSSVISGGAPAALEAARLCSMLSGGIFLTQNCGLFSSDRLEELIGYAEELKSNYGIDSDVPLIYTMKFSIKEDGRLDSDLVKAV
jgi:hypothetical protein